MSNLGYKPLEVKDFSGGMTDFYLQGDPRRYQWADNLQVNVDKKLETRPGSVGFGVGTAAHKPLDNGVFYPRIDSFSVWDTGKELVPVMGRKLFYLDTTWQELLGPTGNEAIGNGQAYDTFSWSEWKGRGHVYFTNESSPLPGKFYKDQDGIYQVRTAGLPASRPTPAYTDASLLATCITLANDMREKFIDHMEDLVLHDSADKWSLSYFEAQSWSGADAENPGPVPTPTPAPDANDEASLFALVSALCFAYEHHAFDPNSPVYHLEIEYRYRGALSLPPKGPFARLKSTAVPTDLDQAVEQLNEVYYKWNWHRLALFTHHAQNTYATINEHEFDEDPIPTVDGIADRTGAPVITQNFDDFIRYANYLKRAWNAHVVNDQQLPTDDPYFNSVLGGIAPGYSIYRIIVGVLQHTNLQQSDNYQVCTLPDATDAYTAELLIYWIWCLYSYLHIQDAQEGQTALQFDSTAANPNLANVEDSDGAALTLTQYMWVLGGFTGASYSPALLGAADTKKARVNSAGSGTAVLSKNAVSTASNVNSFYGWGYYHNAYGGNPAATIENSESLVNSNELVSPTPSGGITGEMQDLPESVAEWVELASSIFTALLSHVHNVSIHAPTVMAIDTPETGPGIENSHWDLAGKNFMECVLTEQGPFFKPQIASYLYSFLYKYEYNGQNGTEFLNLGPPIEVGPIETARIFPRGTVLDTGDDSIKKVDNKVDVISEIEITHLPELLNDLDTNYDEDNILVQIYRTTDTGTTFYLEDEVENGAASYTDQISDNLDGNGIDRLSTRELLYTTGGNVANDPPPRSRFVHLIGNTAYYGYITEGETTFPGRILQSVPGSPDTGPATFFDDVEDELIGVSSAKGVPLAFCKNSLYRFTGQFTQQGLGVLTHEPISEELGCLSAESIVKTEVGVFFAGTDGFYYTDGYQLIKISIDLDLTYGLWTKSDTQKERIYGTYDKLNRRIWWAMQSQPTGTDPDKVFIYHLNYGIKPSGVFTTASNGTHFRPSALAFYQGEIIRGDTRGLIFRHNAIYKTDPKIPAEDTGDNANDWGYVHIPYLYRSCAVDFGTITEGNWASKFHLLGKNVGNANIQVRGISDNRYYSENNKPLAPIAYRDNMRWGDATINWGDAESLWQYSGKLDVRRHFPRGAIRASLKQIEILPLSQGVYRYEDWPEFSFADTVALSKEVNILTPSTHTAITWPTDVVGMTISFENDEYVTEWEIESVASDMIVVIDEDDTLPDLTNQKWVIRGYMKETSISPLSYMILYANVGERGEFYKGAVDRGENG